MRSNYRGWSPDTIREHLNDNAEQEFQSRQREISLFCDLYEAGVHTIGARLVFVAPTPARNLCYGLPYLVIAIDYMNLAIRLKCDSTEIYHTMDLVNALKTFRDQQAKICFDLFYDLPGGSQDEVYRGRRVEL